MVAASDPSAGKRPIGGTAYMYKPSVSVSLILNCVTTQVRRSARQQRLFADLDQLTKACDLAGGATARLQAIAPDTDLRIGIAGHYKA